MDRISTLAMMGLVFVLGWVLIWAIPGEPAYLQYTVATGVIRGAFAATEDIRLDPGDAIIEWMPGTPPNALVWPTPAGCPTGRLEWALMGPGNTVPPILNPALIFWRCYIVTDKRSTYAAVLTEFGRASQNYVGDGNHQSILMVDEALARVCPPGDNSSNCPEIRASFGEIAKLFRGKGQLRTAGEAGAAMKVEADALICAKGWGQPAGGTCP